MIDVMIVYRVEIYDPEGRRGEEWVVRDRFTKQDEAVETYKALISRMTCGKARLTKVIEQMSVLAEGPKYEEVKTRHYYDVVTFKKVDE